MSSPTEADKTRAKELFENGRQLYLDGAYEAAIAAFKESYSLSGDPILLYNIYQCYDRMENYDSAIEYVEYYRAYAPAAERAELTEKVESLRRRKLKAEADQADSGNSGGNNDVAVDTTTGGDSQTDQGPPQRVFTPLAIAFTAVAAVGIGAGIGLGVASNSRRNDAEGFCGGDPLICSAQGESDLDASRNLAIGANVSFAVGGAAAIAVIAIVAVNASKRKKQQNMARTSAHLRPRVEPSATGLSVRF